MESNTTLQLHIAAQYLAAAGKNYVAPKDDDSHTNVGWDAETASFRSRTFSNGDSLCFHTKQMALEWNGEQPDSFVLDGHTHADVLQWLEKTSEQNGLNKYVFDLHYTLESGEIKDDFRYGEADSESLDTHADYRTSSLRACTDVLAELGLESEVRTWPHHFDTGAYVMLVDSDVGVGFGLAMPDSMSADYYLYCSGYKGHDAVGTSDLAALSKGEWKEGSWTGAMLSANGLTSAPLSAGRASDHHLFFSEAINAFKKKTN